MNSKNQKIGKVSTGIPCNPTIYIVIFLLTYFTVAKMYNIVRIYTNHAFVHPLY